MKTKIINTPDMLKAASRKKQPTVFVPASFDKKDELEALTKGEKYYIHTYGCQANVRDEETMRGMLEDVGYSQTDKPEDAQLIIINTCAVRENAEDKVYGEIGNLKILRKKNTLKAVYLTFFQLSVLNHCYFMIPCSTKIFFSAMTERSTCSSV